MKFRPNRKFMRPMAKETHIKTDKQTVIAWGAWELRENLSEQELSDWSAV